MGSRYPARFTVLSMAILFAGTTLKAQTNIPANTIVTQDFNSMTTGLTLPTNWRVSAAGGGLTSTWATGAAVVTQAANSGSPANGGAYNWGTTAGIDRAVGFMTSAGYATPNSVMAFYRNTTGATVTSLTISFTIERYKVNTSNTNLSFFSSTDGTAWTARTAGDISTGAFTPGAATFTFGLPQSFFRTVTITGLNILNNGDFYFRWVFNDAAAATAQGLGLDNVSIYAGVATPVILAQLRDALTVDNGTPNQANPGDELRYTTKIKNIGSGDANNVVLTQPAPTNTTLVPGSVRTSALAKDESYTTNINTPLNVAAGTGVLTNDFGIPSPTVATFGPSANSSANLAGVAGTSDNGGALTVNANGSFTYTPPSATFTGIDKFSYKATNSNAPDNDAIVTITVGVAPIANNDAYTVIGNVQINPVAAQNLFNNDAGSGLSVVAVNGSAANVGVMFTTANGSNITVSANGDFIYNPGPGFDGPESFTYTIDNGFASPQTATVSITITGMVWFINAAAGAGDGRITSPFNSIAAYTAAAGANPPAVNDNIFIYENAAAYTGPVTLLNGQKLIGQDATASLSVITGLTPAVYSTSFPAMNTGGPATTIGSASNAVNLNSASGTNLLRGFTVGNTTGSGISGTGFGTLTISDVSKNGTGQALALTTGAFGATATIDNITTTSSVNAVSLTTITGTLTVTTGAISGATGTAFNINGGTVSVTYSGNITQANNAAMVSISGGHASGTITFNTGTLSATNGTGLQFDNADGTYNFNGTTTLNGGDAGIDILNGSTGTFSFSNNTTITNPSGTAFNLSGATASNANVTYSGSISTNTALAVNIDNHDAGTITFQTGNITGSVQGISITNCGAGTINFNNPTISLTTAGNTAVNLATNAGSAINVAPAGGGNGLDISTTTGTGFNLTGGGTVTVTGTGNTITKSGTGTAININSTNAGASGINFASVNVTGGTGQAINITTSTGTKSLGDVDVARIGGGTGIFASAAGTLNTSTGTINSGNQVAIDIDNTGLGIVLERVDVNGGANGIDLNTTTGSFTINGTGSGNSGGIIQNTTGVGIVMNTVRNVSLNWMQISNTGSHGISGTAMTDGSGGVSPTFAIRNSLLNSPGDADNESALFFDALGVTNITGTMIVEDVTIQNFEDVGIHIGNISGILTVTIDDCIINNNSDVNGEEGVDIDASGTSTINVNITDSRFQDLEGGSMNIVSQGSGTIDLNVNNIVDIGTGGPDNFPTPPAMTFSSEGTSSNFFADITNNTIVDASGDGIFFGHEGEMSVRITGNIITGVVLGDGIRIDTDVTGNQQTRFLIQGNQIGVLTNFESINYSGCGDDGIQILNRDGTKNMHLTINNNQIANIVSEAIRSFTDDDVAGGGPDDLIAITGNTITNVATNGFDNAIVIISQDAGTNVCANITGNTFSGATAAMRTILLQQTAPAILRIPQASVAAMGAANTNAVATSLGTITFNSACAPTLPSHAKLNRSRFNFNGDKGFLQYAISANRRKSKSFPTKGYNYVWRN